MSERDDARHILEKNCVPIGCIYADHMNAEVDVCAERSNAKVVQLFGRGGAGCGFCVLHSGTRGKLSANGDFIRFEGRR